MVDNAFYPGTNLLNTVNDVTFTYTYDDLHRLTGETNTGSDGPLYYAYNAIGNMVSQELGQYIADYNYAPGHPHAVSSLDINGSNYSYTYDTNGNMLSGTDFTNPLSPTSRTLAWNADNMPVSVTRSGVTTSLTYDGMGQRAKKQVGAGSPTYYIGAEYEVIAGVGTTYIFAGNLRIAKVSATGVYYFHKDHLGSSTVMTGDTGAVVEASEYRPYGSFRSQTGTEVSDYKFTDQEWDAESGLYNYDARLYDPMIGRFISADPTVPRPFDPQSLNRFSYCRNNPLIYIDPTGYEDGEELDFNGYEGGISDNDVTGYGVMDSSDGFVFYSDPDIQKIVYEDNLRRKNGGELGLIGSIKSFAYNAYIDFSHAMPSDIVDDREKVQHLYPYAKSLIDSINEPGPDEAAIQKATNAMKVIHDSLEDANDVLNELPNAIPPGTPIGGGLDLAWDTIQAIEGLMDMYSSRKENDD